MKTIKNQTINCIKRRKIDKNENIYCKKCKDGIISRKEAYNVYHLEKGEVLW